jgi:hypothetical protein
MGYMVAWVGRQNREMEVEKVGAGDLVQPERAR